MPRRRPKDLPSARGYRDIRCPASAVHVSDLAVQVTDPDPDNGFDNQVVVEVNGVQFLDKDLEHIHGGDPEVLLGPAGLLLPGDDAHQAPLGAPTWCVAECCGVAATVLRDSDLIVWQLHGDRWNHRLLPQTIYFDAEQYLFAVESAWDDRSWERPARATARLVVEQLRAHDPLGAIGCERYEASASIRSDTVDVRLYFPTEDPQTIPPWRSCHFIFADDAKPPEARAARIVAVLTASDPRGRLPDADADDQMQFWRTW
ncbi:hypothetical protein ABIA31_006174 [Catenulispora sp. MAP5-51]